MADDLERIEEQEDAVADEATPETDLQAVEQRTDDYDATVRRLDDIADMIQSVLEAVKRIEGITGAFVDAGAVVSEDAGIEETETSINDIARDEVEDFITIDDLDLG